MASDWERIGHDPALLDDARRRYRGDGDLLDQLWWIEHPGEPTPGGVQDPRASIEAMRRDLYRPNGATIGTGTVAEQLAAAETDRELAADAAAAALAAARPLVGTARAVRPGRAVPLAAALVAACAALLLGAGVGYGAATRPTAEPTTSAAYRVLARERRPIDALDRALVPSFVKPSSVRLLRTYSSVGTQVYAATTGGNRVCLIAVVLATRPAASCTTRPAFAIAGLSLVVQAEADPVDDSGRRPTDELELLWQDDGNLSITPTPEETRS